MVELGPWVGKIAWRAWQPNPVFLPGESHGQRILAGYSPQGRTDSEMTEVTSYAGTVSLVAVPNWHSSIDGGSSLLHTLSSLGSLQCLTMAILTIVRWYLTVVLIWISLIVSKVGITSCDFFLKGYEWSILQLTLERLLCALMSTPGTFLEGRCCLLTIPRAFWILSAHQHSFWCCYGK